MGNLLIQIGRWLLLSTVPSEEARNFSRVAAHSTYVLLPILGAICMILGLHTQIAGFYVAAALLSFIPVVLMDIARRFGADLPLVGKTTESTISTLATPHTWLGILNFWFIVLQPRPEYVIQAYLAILGVSLFIVASGRWHKEPKWYKPLTRIGLFLPALFAVGQLAMDAFWPEELIALKNAARTSRMEATRSLHGSRIDQNVVVVRELGTCYPLDQNGQRTQGRLLQPGTNLWKTKADLVPLGGTLYATYMERAKNGAQEPDYAHLVLFPENLTAPTSLPSPNRLAVVGKTVPFRLDTNNDGRPEPTLYDNNRPGGTDMVVQVTASQTYLAGQALVMCLIQDNPNLPNCPVWVEKTSLDQMASL